MRPVVGAAVLREGRVLAARRTTPPAAAGRWELPGGKVEPGESPEDAVVREVHEELSCAVEVSGWLAGSVPIGDAHVLSVALVRLVDGEPRAGEHDRLRWLSAEELHDVDWLEPDRPFLVELGSLLRRSSGGSRGGSRGGSGGGSRGPGRGAGMMGAVRGIFFDEDDARAVVARLTGDGFEASLVRERLAGEDDDEDHPWAVLTDAPAPVLELLVDQHDGWFDAEPGAAPAPAPLDLPSAPRRVKRP